MNYELRSLEGKVLKTTGKSFFMETDEPQELSEVISIVIITTAGRSEESFGRSWLLQRDGLMRSLLAAGCSIKTRNHD